MISDVLNKDLEGLVKRNSRDVCGGSLVKSGNDNNGFGRNAIIDAEVVEDRSFSCRNKIFNNHLFYIPAVIGALALGSNYGGCASKSEEPTIVANSNNPVEMQSFSNNSNQNQPRRVYSSGVLTAGSNLNSADLDQRVYENNPSPSIVLNVENYVDAPGASRVNLGPEQQRGFVGTNDSRRGFTHGSSNRGGVPEEYTLNHLDRDAQSALTYLADKRNAVRKAIIHLEESKGRVYSSAVSDVGGIVRDVMNARGSHNRELNRQDQRFSRNQSGNRIERYPSREVYSAIGGFGNVLEGLNTNSNIEGQLIYLIKVDGDVISEEAYIQNSLATSLDNKLIDNNLRTKLLLVNAESNARNKAYGFNVTNPSRRNSGRGYSSSGRGFTR